ncbi:hypothetical protein QFC19_008934 [Naganishia cerealis]|uniref:Uncharacterized protein n=1 Tax=Naganishia cerealis TaxID=610337 RepID=A0ACC2UYJ6_9TREE|nr:hypothetical protein QFC19_008934 [Naganishia cerealis]
MSSSRFRSDYGTYNDNDSRPQPPLHLHTLPKGHGPASSSSRISTAYSLSSLEHAPAFVKAVGDYDELGRSLADGVGAAVDDDPKGKGKRKEGEALTFWKGLELGPKEGTLSPTPVLVRQFQDGSLGNQSPQSVPTVLSPQRNVQPDERPGAVPTSRPLVVPPEQWFIRKALIAKAQRERERADSTDRPSTSASPAASTAESSVSGTPATRPSTPSLATLLSASLPPLPTGVPGAGEQIEAFHPPAYFHLKPNNKGWQVLRNIGWDESGGLGRAETQVSSRLVSSPDYEIVKKESGEQEIGQRSVLSSSSPGRPARAGTCKAEDSVIDLTLDSASDSGTDMDATDELGTSEKFGQDVLATSHAPSSSFTRSHGSGSGRTAPVATYLKTDLRGIGALSASERQRNLLRPGTLSARSSASPSSAATKRKRVTHTNEEIRALAQERRGTGEGLMGEERVAFDKKKAKRDAKVDRQERQRWREIINM